jgi:hypothetical protein
MIARNLNIPLKDTADSSKFPLDIGERLSHMPAYQANVFREAYHIGNQQTLFAIERAEQARQRYEESLKSQGEAGIGGDAMKRATQFEQAWREVWQRIGTMAEGGESKLLTGLTKPMQDFNKWLDQHQPELDQSIGKIATSLDHLAEQWTVDLAKIALGDDQTKGINDAADAITHFVDSLQPLIRELDDLNTKSKDWWITKFINGAASGNLVTPLPSGPGFVAAHGPGVSAGDIGGGISGWWQRNMPGWLGGGSSSGASDAKGITQNGAHVSDSNPLRSTLSRPTRRRPAGAAGCGLCGTGLRASLAAAVKEEARTARRQAYAYAEIEA